MPKFEIGDSIRFTKTGITAKITDIGVDPNGDDFEERYFFTISADDVELIVGEGAEIVSASIPVKNDDFIEKI